MTQNSVLIIIGGGIAAYKSLETIRALSRRGIRSRAILTRAGAEFITPLSVASLTGDKCYTDLFDLTDEAEMGHIELSRSADLVLVAPATADLMAKTANGLANDLASTALLATDKPVIWAPAMNVRMWEHPATRRNVRTLKGDGGIFVGPGEGEMACGEFGSGRLAEPTQIADAVEAWFDAHADGRLTGRHVLVTAGPTHEPLDPVRYIANRSSGKQGYAIARALARMGAKVTLVTGPTGLTPPAGVDTVKVETARQMLAACEAALPADCAVCCAAVADYRPQIETEHKIKKERGGLSTIALSENPDILRTLSNHETSRPKLVIGFAAETDDVIGHADAKRKRKGCDWIVANDVSPGTGTMGGDNNTVTILSEEGEEAWDNMPKAAVAGRLAEKIADALLGKK
ncbi:bifunctional phosphopantothenoylcysteine decarboxylase/phosphopantothenate--cysteine ligase CoaBC [Aquisalinus flavus]|uniref:Coenzyme A biosynthesis bifunctional protein CoaBC n=1 Tax=Aquisalinus flavus TaxID=1526572 RepID=A0A8J2V284_9PROT|nr:bifunctional phosphopantothenoylcysteine decarboxylase/phosphopantothenate--cysteine ligase CoaBC [Aquisalinus flavus]MBD0425339.1 bifunctional phosphopantothenoylcysteine decarboxylase/phosphopantothenate--cysteine ligase CoaBC [Aquisalinus flavus]UNE49010.1 bifunctional phosphopantothenoylcysteine decarboxylase/phosphopantothenate--cysteine ligase CoaBC [Aquisalinus flavus]GGD16882.1 phosphopantothenate synthase [Aquisalinus flavus]